ncbi:MAG: hypothetical protein R3F56_19985 [Planctomycetota bacterium]
MNMAANSLHLLLGGAALATAFGGRLPGQGPSDQQPATTFAAPVRLRAGESFLGERRLFPSPVFHDVNGDGRDDIVIGDLIGRMTYALRQADGSYAAEAKLEDEEGKQIDFHNW